jgi:hypothetical protein
MLASMIDSTYRNRAQMRMDLTKNASFHAIAGIAEREGDHASSHTLADLIGRTGACGQ